jgi:hypothetical protein
MENQCTFHRFEKKYMLSPWAYRHLRRLLSDEMTEDQYALHTITSVYFDTDDYDIIRASVQQPLFKEKLRLRWYGIPKPQEPVFLELKRKYRGMVYKRRVPVLRTAADQLLHADSPTLAEGQVCREVDWFIRRYRPMPKILLAYDREALQSKRDPELRLTFDHNIRWRSDDFSASSGSYGASLLPEEKVLMEIKSVRNLPIWLTDMLAQEKIYPSSFSKYGSWYEQIYLQKGNYQHVG